MAKRKKQEDFDDVIVDVVDGSSSGSPLSGKNMNMIFGAVGLLALLIGGYFAYNSLVKEPKQQDAVSQMFQAQFQFDRDSFKVALTNPGGGYPGFLDIIDKYPGTPAGNLANYYAAVSYLKLGDFDAALSYLTSFTPPDDVMKATKNGLMGDLTGEKGDLEGALTYYQKAANTDNELVTPYYLKKMGMLLTKLGKQDEAIKAFQQIKEKYPSSLEGRDIDKYL